MESPFFPKVMTNYKDDKFDALNGYRDLSNLKKFFANLLKD